MRVYYRRICLFALFFTTWNIIHAVLEGRQVHKTENCYGQNLVLNCPGEGEHMYVYDVMINAKLSSLSCPDVMQSDLSRTDACCYFSNENEDCGTRYFTNSTTMTHYIDCTGYHDCTVPVARGSLSGHCEVTSFPSYSTYMSVYYHCIDKKEIYAVCLQETNLPVETLFIANFDYPLPVTSSEKNCETSFTTQYGFFLYLMDVRLTCNQELIFKDTTSNAVFFTLDCMSNNQFDTQTAFVTDKTHITVYFSNNEVSDQGYYFIFLSGATSPVTTILPKEQTTVSIATSTTPPTPQLTEFVSEHCFGQKLNATCKAEEMIYMKDVFVRAKPKSLNCPYSMYSEDLHRKDECCYYSQSEDCGKRSTDTGSYSPYIECSGKQSCDVAVPYSTLQDVCDQSVYDSENNYATAHYVCIPRSQIYELCSDTEITMNDSTQEVYILSPRYPYEMNNYMTTCEVNVRTNQRLLLTILDLRLSSVQTITISDLTSGQSLYTLTSDYNNKFVETAIPDLDVYSINIQLEKDTTIEGVLWVKLSAVSDQASSTKMSEISSTTVLNQRTGESTVSVTQMESVSYQTRDTTVAVSTTGVIMEFQSPDLDSTTVTGRGSPDQSTYSTSTRGKVSTLSSLEEVTTEQGSTSQYTLSGTGEYRFPTSESSSPSEPFTVQIETNSMSHFQTIPGSTTDTNINVNTLNSDVTNEDNFHATVDTSNSPVSTTNPLSLSPTLSTQDESLPPQTSDAPLRGNEVSLSTQGGLQGQTTSVLQPQPEVTSSASQVEDTTASAQGEITLNVVGTDDTTPIVNTPPDFSSDQGSSAVTIQINWITLLVLLIVCMKANLMI